MGNNTGVPLKEISMQARDQIIRHGRRHFNLCIYHNRDVLLINSDIIPTCHVMKYSIFNSALTSI
ncbi:hypothetical protein HOLleu_32972 [Holothuria leucospilota]|uniref:Uncharacterized protein n=1 Tax=Holothuria leucospilota TaxID=206669 RepID=A0A9Q0YS29_HOLLE|nr:hypothetical protein HOLleu_32972 [Holothuria leucospilota]